MHCVRRRCGLFGRASRRVDFSRVGKMHARVKHNLQFKITNPIKRIKHLNAIRFCWANSEKKSKEVKLLLKILVAISEEFYYEMRISNSVRTNYISYILNQ